MGECRRRRLLLFFKAGRENHGEMSGDGAGPEPRADAAEASSGAGGRRRPAWWIAAAVGASCAVRLIVGAWQWAPLRTIPGVPSTAAVIGPAATVDSTPRAPRLAVATLVMRGQLAMDSVETLLCAPLVMFDSVRRHMTAPFVAVAVAGFLGPPCANVSRQPLRRCRKAQLRDASFWAQHETAVAQLGAALEPRGVRVWQGVTRDAVARHPALAADILFVKVRALELGADLGVERLLFLDADVIVIADPLPLLLADELLLAYQTCGTPMNAGCFALRLDRVPPDSLARMGAVFMRARARCDTPDFFAGGYDGRALGSPPWPGAALCPGRAALGPNETWRFPTACIADQGLPFFFFGTQLRSYRALNYTQVPIVHWNGAGPKPWVEPTPGQRHQRCWRLWWHAYAQAARTPLLDGLPCARQLASAWRRQLADVRRANESARAAHSPSCFKCVGGGHAACLPNCPARFLRESCVRVTATQPT